MYHCCRLCLVRCAHYFLKPLHVKWDPFYYLVRRLSMYFIFSVKEILQMHHMTIFYHCLNDRCFHQAFSTFSSLLKSLMDVFFTSNCSNINYFRAFFSVIWCLFVSSIIYNAVRWIIIFSWRIRSHCCRRVVFSWSYKQLQNISDKLFNSCKIAHNGKTSISIYVFQEIYISADKIFISRGSKSTRLKFYEVFSMRFS